MSPGPDISLAWQIRTDWRAAGLLVRAARHAATAEGFGAGAISIAVVGARRMAGLHQRYLGQPGPTDVLTFDLGTNRRRRHIEGQIVVCADVARRRAGQGSGPARLRRMRAELALYVVHGVLHLAGYDDRTPAGFRRMHAREDALLEGLGLGRVFARGE